LVSDDLVDGDRTLYPPPNAKQSNSPGNAWYKIGAVLLLLAMAFLFFDLAPIGMKHKSYDDVPPARNAPGKPGEVISHSHSQYK
jgi:hypothetical protein